VQALTDRLHAVFEGRTGAVQLVHITDARHAVAGGLAPHRLALRLDAGDAVEDTDSASRTRSERSTSMVKSTWPGVSMMLIWWSCQKHVVAAEVMVMPRSCSCSIQSIVAAPSCTSPIL